MKRTTIRHGYRFCRRWDALPRGCDESSVYIPDILVCIALGVDMVSIFFTIHHRADIITGGLRVPDQNSTIWGSTDP
jgi:hypothetical protein